MWLLLLGAAAAAPIALDEARDAAVSRGLEVEAARARAAAARGDALAAWSGHLPSVAAFASGSVGSGRTSFGFDRPVGTQVGVGLSASWTVVAPASWAAASAARHTAEGQQALAAWSAVHARRSATVAFSEVVSADAAVSAWSASLDDVRAATGAIEQRVTAGLIPPVDGARARAEVARVAARLRQAEGALSTACATLLGVMGETPLPSCEVAAPSWDSALVAPEPAPSGTHPAVAASEAALAAAESGLRGAGLERAPSVSLSGTTAAYAADGDALAPGWSAGVDVDLPLITGAETAGELRAGRSEVAVARAELEIQERDLAIVVVSAEARYRAAFATVEAQQAALDAAEAALVQVQQRHAAGISPLQEWLDARRDRDAAAVGLAEARREQLAALAEIEAARGVW